jgi:hypothetical protein
MSVFVVVGRLGAHTIHENWARKVLSSFEDRGEGLWIIDIDPILEWRDKDPYVAHFLMRTVSVLDLPASPVVSREAVVAKRKALYEGQNFAINQSPEWVHRADWDNSHRHTDRTGRSVVFV